LAATTSPDSAIGLGERFKALGAISASSGFVGVASWFVRVFFILIDCLPVLVKFIGGTTAYDRLVEREIAHAERLHASELDEEATIGGRESQARVARRMMEIELEARRNITDQQTVHEAAIRERARQKLATRQGARAAADRAMRATSDVDLGRTVGYANGTHGGD
jgi:hypothetical protein